MQNLYKLIPRLEEIDTELNNFAIKYGPTLTLEEMSRLLLKMNETLINQANEIKALKSNVDTLNKLIELKKTITKSNSGISEIDTEMLKAVRKFLGQFPSYIPVFFSNYGGVGNFWWPQITAGAVLVSHRKYLKAFLLIFFTQGSYILVDHIKNMIGRDRPTLHAGYSFPSGHSMAAFGFYGYFIYLISISKLNKKSTKNICLVLFNCLKK